MLLELARLLFLNFIANSPLCTASLDERTRIPCANAGKTMEATLQRLGAIHTGYIGQSSFVKPLGIYYELDGKERKW